MSWLDFIFPARCFGCNKIDCYFCASCRRQFLPASFQICPQCNKAHWQGRTHEECATRYSLDGLVSVFSYRGLLREAIKRMKYEPFIKNAWPELTELAIKELDNSIYFGSYREFLERQPLIIPIPLDRKRRKWRGFNQAEIIGKILTVHYSLPGTGRLLARIRITKPQYLLEKDDRRKNIKGAFKANIDFIKRNKEACHNALLVDDITTTGSTLREAARVLKKAGVGDVWGLTICARR